MIRPDQDYTAAHLAEHALALWVIYVRPLDFPKHCVVRRQWAVGGVRVPVPDRFACLYDTVQEAMVDCEAKGLTWLGRSKQDDPTIVGVWL